MLIPINQKTSFFGLELDSFMLRGNSPVSVALATSLADLLHFALRQRFNGDDFRTPPSCYALGNNDASEQNAGNIGRAWHECSA